jgi:hypothetical protein
MSNRLLAILTSASIAMASSLGASAQSTDRAAGAAMLCVVAPVLPASTDEAAGSRQFMEGT